MTNFNPASNLHLTPVPSSCAPAPGDGGTCIVRLAQEAEESLIVRKFFTQRRIVAEAILEGSLAKRKRLHRIQ